MPPLPLLNPGRLGSTKVGISIVFQQVCIDSTKSFHGLRQDTRRTEPLLDFSVQGHCTYAVGFWGQAWRTHRDAPCLRLDARGHRAIERARGKEEASRREENTYLE